MRRLLFALADPQNRQALETALGAHQGIWDAQVICNAEAAQERLKDADLDAVVADLESETGRSIFLRARECFPEVARIGIVPKSRAKIPHPSFVHQTIASALDFKELEVAVERSCRLRDLLRGERICRMIGEVGELPQAPAVYLDLMDKLNEPETSVGEIAQIIEGDVGISAKLLQVVNSVLFRTSREIVTVKMAAGFLGMDVIKSMVLSLEAFEAFGKIPDVPGFSWNSLQAHCRLTAAIVGQLPLAAEVKDAAIVAALLHDIGKLVIAYKMPDRFARLLARARAEQRPLYQIEEELWGITHAEVGAYLLGLWGLPILVTEAIAYHHAPSAVPHRCFDALAAVYVANLLAHENEGNSEGQEWDGNLLESLGVLTALPGWKAMAKQTAAGQQESQRVVEARLPQRIPVA